LEKTPSCTLSSLGKVQRPNDSQYIGIIVSLVEKEAIKEV
jgi:hypothetical protein